MQNNIKQYFPTCWCLCLFYVCTCASFRVFLSCLNAVFFHYFSLLLEKMSEGVLLGLNFKVSYTKTVLY